MNVQGTLTELLSNSHKDALSDEYGSDSQDLPRMNDLENAERA